MIVVVGATLAGVAAAARLARVGHQVVLLDRAAGPAPLLPSPLDEDPSVLVLPAAWRDLFKKSGRPLDAELSRRGLSLVPAPPSRYETPGGTLVLPHDRAGQWHTLVAEVGPEAAAAWRDLLDRLDRSWLALRPLGVEAEFSAARLDRTTRGVLRPRESLADLARLVGPRLGSILTDLGVRRDSAPEHTPGWLGTRLSIERTFGRWQLAGAGGTTEPTSVLTDLLWQRLADRGVEVRWATPAEQVSPGLVATAGERLACRAVVITTDPWQHLALTGGADRDLARRTRRLTPASTAGPRWRGWRTLLDLPPLRTGQAGSYAASAFSPAGPEPWAQLLTGALAAYRVHEDLTGQDMRPTNKAWRPGQARTVISTSTNMSDRLGPA